MRRYDPLDRGRVPRGVGGLPTHLEDRVDDAASETDDLLGLLADNGIDPETALDVACGDRKSVV